MWHCPSSQNRSNSAAAWTFAAAGADQGHPAARPQVEVDPSRRRSAGSWRTRARAPAAAARAGRGSDPADRSPVPVCRGRLRPRPPCLASEMAAAGGETTASGGQRDRGGERHPGPAAQPPPPRAAARPDRDAAAASQADAQSLPSGPAWASAVRRSGRRRAAGHRRRRRTRAIGGPGSTSVRLALNAAGAGGALRPGGRSRRQAGAPARPGCHPGRERHPHRAATSSQTAVTAPAPPTAAASGGPTPRRNRLLGGVRSDQAGEQIPGRNACSPAGARSPAASTPRTAGGQDGTRRRGRRPFGIARPAPHAEGALRPRRRRSPMGGCAARASMNPDTQRGDPAAIGGGAAAHQQHRPPHRPRQRQHPTSQRMRPARPRPGGPAPRTLPLRRPPGLPCAARPALPRSPGHPTVERRGRRHGQASRQHHPAPSGVSASAPPPAHAVAHEDLRPAMSRTRAQDLRGGARVRWASRLVGGSGGASRRNARVARSAAAARRQPRARSPSGVS